MIITHKGDDIMKKKMLSSIILSTLTFATIFTGCGDNKPVNETATEVVEVVTEATEVAEVTEIETEVTEEPTEAVTETTEVTEVTEATEVPEYTVTEMNATKYAKQSANVRKGPSKEYESIGSLSTNQKVTITGQADTGWYRIDYNGTEAYVSNSLLVDNKVAVNTPSTNTSSTTSSSSNTQSTSTTNNSTPTSTDTTGQQTWTGDTNTNTSVPDNSSSNTATTDTSASTSDTSAPTDSSTNANTGTSVECGGMTAEDLNNMMGVTDAIGTGGSAGTGVGGDWIE